MFSIINKLFHDLVKEIVIALCGCVLGALFFYIFDDFINKELSNLSYNLKALFAKILSWTLWGAISFFLGSLISKNLNDPRSIFNFSKKIGETPKIIRIYLSIFIGSTYLIFGGSVLFVIQSWLSAWVIEDILHLTIVLLGVGLVGFSSQSSVKTLKHRSLKYPKSKILILFVWRLQQLFYRSKSMRWCAMLALFFVLLNFYSSIKNLPFLANFLSSFSSSLFISFGLILFLSEDIKHCWLERQSGVSHRDFLFSINLLSLFLGLINTTINIATYEVSRIFANSAENYLFSTNHLTIISVSLALPMLVPQVFFQIDPRRSSLIMITCFILGLFLCTAFFASPFAIILLPVTIYYGWVSQEGRFYRA